MSGYSETLKAIVRKKMLRNLNRKVVGKMLKFTLLTSVIKVLPDTHRKQRVPPPEGVLQALMKIMRPYGIIITNNSNNSSHA